MPDGEPDRQAVQVRRPDPGQSGRGPEGTGGGGQGCRRFKRQEHLKRRAEITRVFKQGRAAGCPGARLFFLANGLVYNRIVITFVRKYGNAVRRNRARRVNREAYRLIKDRLKSGYDLVLLLYPRPEFPNLAESTGQLKTLFRKAGMG